MDDKHAGIFGSPPEPIFNLTPQSMNAELLQDWLLVLANENAEAVKTAKHKQGYFKTGDFAEFLFLTCDKLHLSQEAKYLAVEMLDRFMVKHTQHLYTQVLGLSSQNPKQEWDDITDQLRMQLPLRVISCCQIASKLTSHYKIVSARRVQRMLQEFGCHYNLSSVLHSELRILKTLNYKVQITSPLVFMETILEILGHNDHETEVKVYHGISLKVLDLLYIQRQQIYNELYNLAIKNTTPSVEKRQKFATVENDNMLLSVTVITVASYILNHRRTQKVVEGLSNITRIPPEDILDFAIVIVQHITGSCQPSLV